jgi:hypothetical protein
MNIVIQYDSSVNSAPAGFKAAVAAAVQFLDTTFSNPVSITIDVGYGEVGGQSLGPGALGESSTFLTSVSYAQLENALPAGTLPLSDPTNGGSYEISRAEAKALGILGAGSGIDGFVGFSSSQPFTYDPLNRAVAGKYDFIGVFEHEITEVMGRISMLGSGSYSLMDLFRYSAPGQLSLSAAQPGYFSIDGGQTNLDNFNASSGGDLGDWAASAGNDAFLAFSKSGVMNAFSAADVTLMKTLGYGSSPPPAVTVIASVTEQPSTGDLNAGKTVTITLNFNEAVTVSGGVPSLKLNDGGSASYASGSGTSALTFSYTIGAQDSSVASLAATAVNLNGATIADGSGHFANLSLSGLTQNGPQIDTTIPAVTALVEQPNKGTVSNDQTVTITLAMTEAVTVKDGTPLLLLNDGGTAIYSSGSGTNALTFLYGVGVHDTSVASLAATSVDLNGATIADGAGNAANLSLSGLSQSGVQVTVAAVGATTLQGDYLAITRAALPLDQATTIANAISAGTQTEAQYINSLLSQVASTTIPAVAVEGSMYGAVGSSAEITMLATQFLPAQVALAALHGLNQVAYASEALGLAFAFGNENGGTGFANQFGPSNASMPNTTAGDAAFAAAAASAIFGSAAMANTPGAIQSFVANWKAFYTAHGIPGIASPTAVQIDLAARGAAWGDGVGVALANNLGALSGQAANFLEDAAQGIAAYSASLSSQPTHSSFQGGAFVGASETVSLIGTAAHHDGLT